MGQEILGIPQEDVLLRTALEEIVHRIQTNPELVDDIFRSLLEDELTVASYGQAEIEAAKRWFINTEIPVRMSYQISSTAFPCLSVSLMGMSETEMTLGDVHYEPAQESEAPWPPLAGPFTPIAYSPSSGIFVIDPSDIEGVVVKAGMSITDRNGTPHLIYQALDDDSFAVTPNTVADFTNAFLKGARPKQVTTVESVNNRVSYQVGVHVQGEHTYLQHLFSIVYWGLLKYKEELLEYRGLERTTMSASDFMRNNEFDSELVFSRGISITGYSRASWPKATYDRTEDAAAQLIAGLDQYDADQDPPNDELWAAEEPS